MPETHFIERMSGWGVAAIAGLLNIILLTWGRVIHNSSKVSETRLNKLEESKVNQNDFEKHAENCNHNHDVLFRKIDDLHSEIGATRREIKGDIKMVAGLIRNGNRKGE